MKIVTVIGARPQFIKASLMSLNFLKKNINEVIVHTGQHFDTNMSEIFFDEMEIPKPKYNLNIQSLTHGAMTGRQIEEIEKILFKEKPDWLLVYGDTNSTLSGALAAAKMNIKIAHVESGLRSFNKNMPEEINRLLTDHLSDILFVPSLNAENNLISEGISKEKIQNVGDIMYETSIFFSKFANKKSKILKKLKLKKKEYVLSTVHRQENTDNKERLHDIFTGLSYSKLPVFIPIHPRTMKKVKDYNLVIEKNINFIPPLGYLDMILLQKNASLIATDSGGIQKEAYFYNVPCLTLRDETEWIELVESGANFLCGSNVSKIKSYINRKFEEIKRETFYGDGKTSSKILNFLNK